MKLREKEVEVGCLYFTGANQYRAVLGACRIIDMSV